MEKTWLKNYPAGVPAEIDADLYPSLVDLMETAFAKFPQQAAYKMMGRQITFSQIDAASKALAAVLRAGFVVVNVNPLYTPRELEHQLKDAGAKAIVILENFAATLQQVLA